MIREIGKMRRRVGIQIILSIILSWNALTDEQKPFSSRVMLDHLPIPRDYISFWDMGQSHLIMKTKANRLLRIAETAVVLSIHGSGQHAKYNRARMVHQRLMVLLSGSA